MSREKMEEVLYDFQLAQAIVQNRYNDFNSDEKKEALLNSILNKHGVTKEVFDSSLIWYSDNIDVYLRVNDSVVSQLRAHSSVLEKALKLTRDSRLLLQNRILPPYYYFTQQKPFISFNIDSTTIRKEGTSLISLSFDVLGGYPDFELDLSLLFEYADTSVIESVTVKDNPYSIKMSALPERSLQNISGYIRVDSLSVTDRVLLYNIDIVQDSSKVIQMFNEDMKTLTPRALQPDLRKLPPPN